MEDILMEKYDFNQIMEYSIDFGSLLDLPCYVFIKNTHGVYLTYNDYGAINLGYKNGDEIAGKTDLEIFPTKVADTYRNNDIEVLKKKEKMFIPEKGVLKDNFPVIFMSYKMPLYDQNKKLVGIGGLAFTQPIHEEDCPGGKLLSASDHAEIHNHSSRKLNPSCLSLSPKEMLCVQYLSEGLTVKMIAQRLKLSPKSIETYIERAKIKMNLSNKTQLILAFTKTCMD